MVIRASAIATLAAALVLSVVAAPAAQAHQPVNLTSKDRSAPRGPLLVDGTISYAVYARTARQGATRGFRFTMASGQPLRVQLLILDRAPANGLADRRMPRVAIVAPDGRKTILRINERTPFYEPYSGQSYLYLSRYSGTSVAGTYKVSIRSRTSTPVTAVVAVGYREVPGTVRR